MSIAALFTMEYEQVPIKQLMHRENIHNGIVFGNKEE
jgi:hypothetical protein